MSAPARGGRRDCLVRRVHVLGGSVGPVIAAQAHGGSVTTAMFLVVAIALFGAALVLTGTQTQPGCDTACQLRRGEVSVVS